ncbi:hypothetical protein [Streptosporangium sandarakinum]|uniref:hypothetical protein n=1 Tax=Streptosporangium sandarakinum TaxID=1260955 RepID=UPI0034383968
MHTLIRSTGAALTGALLAGGLLASLPTAAHAASAPLVARVAQAAPAVACTADATASGWICFLRYCDAYYCYYDCYPTLQARTSGQRPGKTIRVPKPTTGSPAPTMTSD